MGTWKNTLRLCALLLATALSTAADLTPLLSQVQPVFIENKGQISTPDVSLGAVRYYTRLRGIEVFFCDQGFSYVMRSAATQSHSTREGSINPPAYNLRRMDFRFLGAHASANVHASQVQTRRLNYYRPSLAAPITDLPCYAEIQYDNLYPGIDLRFDIRDGALKYEFIVQPGADPSSIALHLERADGVRKTDEGQLEFIAGAHSLFDEAPIAWQTHGDAAQRKVEVAFSLTQANTIGFDCGAYDRSKELTIDPAITWATFFGGTNDDLILDMSLDRSSNLVICGASTSDVLPGTATLNNGDYDMVLSLFSPGGALLSTTYLGSTSLDVATGLAIDKNGSIFVCGLSKSYDLGFAANVAQAYNAKTLEKDGVIIKFDASLKFKTGTFIGGTDVDEALDIAVDSLGNAVVVGQTFSADFKIQGGTYPIWRGDFDAFITKWSSNLNYIWGTYYGGTGGDRANAVACDANNRIVVGGESRSLDLTDLNGSIQTNRGEADGLIMIWSAGGSPILMSLHGARGFDNIFGIALASNRIAICGVTTSASEFPAYANTHAYDHSGNTSDGYVTLFNDKLQGQWSTVWGGVDAEYFNSLAINQDSTIVCVGSSSSPDFPTKRPFQANHKDFRSDIVLCKFNPLGSIVWATALGGSGQENASFTALALDALGNAYVGGSSSSTDFPTRNAQFPSLKDAKGDGVIAKICPTTPVVTSSTSDTIICAGRTIQLHADADLTNIKWSTGQNTATIDVATAGYYSYEADSKLGCRALSDTIHLIVENKVPVSVQLRGKTAICPGDSVLLYSRNAYDGYSWKDQNGSEVGTKDSLYVKTAGSYYLQVIDLGGCHDKSPVFNIAVNSKPKLKYSALIDGKTLIDSVRKDLIVCQGQQVELRMGTGTSYFVYWSNAAVGQVLPLTSTQHLVAFVTDSSGCQWVMDSVNVIFTKSVPVPLSTADTVCASEISVVKASQASPSDTFYWLIEGGTIIGNADSSTISVQWFGLGTHSIRCYPRGLGGCADTGRYTVVVQNTLSGHISTPDGKAICVGSTLRLQAPPGYVNYVWNGQAGTLSELRVLNAGRYVVRFDNGKGCEGSDSVDVTNALSYTAGFPTLFYDSTRLGLSRQDRYLVVNNGTTDMHFNAQVVGGGSFTIDSIVPAPAGTILPGDSAWVYVRFSPQSTKDLYDSVMIRISLPCADSFVVRLHGIGKSLPPAPVVRFRLQDLDLDPAISPVSVPIQAWIEPAEEQPRIDSLSFRLDYPSQMLFFNSTSQGSLKNTWDPGRQRMTAVIKVFVDSLRSVPTTITTLSATVFLGDRLKDTMRIDSCQPSPAMTSSLKVESAEIRYQNLCQAGGTRLLGQSGGAQMLVAPNPASESIHIRVQAAENAHHSLSLYDLRGQLIWSLEQELLLNSQHEIELSCSKMDSGMYILRFQGPTTHLELPIQVLR